MQSHFSQPEAGRTGATPCREKHDILASTSGKHNWWDPVKCYNFAFLKVNVYEYHKEDLIVSDQSKKDLPDTYGKLEQLQYLKKDLVK